MEISLKPRLELRVGITGHRPPRLRTEALERIQQELTSLLSAMIAELRHVHAERASYFSDEPARLVLVSPLAAGADCMAAQAALDIGAELDACLPFPRERYREDFDAAQQVIFDQLIDKAARVMSLPGDQPGSADPYKAIGTLTLAQSDLLVAIWDGQPAAGQGGTSDVVAEAVAEHTPVLVIDANGEQAIKLLWSGSDTEPHDMPTIETVEPVDADAVLDGLIHALTLPPDSDSSGLANFFGEASHARQRPIGYPLLMFITRARTWSSAFARATPEQSADQIRPMLDAFAPGTNCAAYVESLLLPRFAAADTAANYYALKYRGGFISNFVMSALAVMLALSGLLFPDFKIVFIVAELFIIFTIVHRTRVASKAGWHRRWIDMRHLAELLRTLTLSSALGTLSLRRRGDVAEPAGWPGWYARATAREVGMPPAELDGEHVALIRDRALQMINEQRAYHRNNAHRMEKIDHWLRHVGEALFVVTIMACVVWLVVKFTIGSHVELLHVSLTAMVTFLSALLPAVGAALYGIRMQGDFAASAERSTSIRGQLDRLRLAIERDPLDNRRLAGRLRRLSEIMLSEIDQWRQMSEIRPLELPG